jgi:hypothetical protein
MANKVQLFQVQFTNLSDHNIMVRHVGFLSDNNNNNNNKMVLGAPH